MVLGVKGEGELELIQVIYGHGGLPRAVSMRIEAAVSC
jgi:hypothetical protein